MASGKLPRPDDVVTSSPKHANAKGVPEGDAAFGWSPEAARARGSCDVDPAYAQTRGGGTVTTSDAAARPPPPPRVALDAAGVEAMAAVDMLTSYAVVKQEDGW